MKREPPNKADKRKIEKFISHIPVFASLPKTIIQLICTQIETIKINTGEVLAVQNKTVIQKVYLVNSGALELFYEKGTKKISRGELTQGDIFGGISIIMNSCMSVRTVIAKDDSILFALPVDVFLEICTSHGRFYAYFVKSFHERMLDKSYATMFHAGQAIGMLSKTIPFSYLPEEELKTICRQLSVVFYSKGTILFFQDTSSVEYLHIIKKGVLERYFEEKGEKTLYGKLKQGDTFGGISMLVNDGISVRTARVASNTYFYTLPKTDFLRLCEHYSQFSDYFTNTFGKRMIDRSYAAIIRKKTVSDSEAPQLFNLRVADVYQGNVLWCHGSDSIQQASMRMNQKQCSSIFVKSSTGEYIGLVTDQDIRSKVVATGHDIQGPVTDIMSSPLHCLPMNAMVSDAMMEMMENNIKHLAVTAGDTDVVGILTNSDILSAQESSPFFLIRDIGAASTVEELSEKRSRLPKVIKSMINNGAKSIVVTKLITKVSDVILNKLLDLALEQHGPAPADFAFFVLGSEGRMEQTLKTDQDNAIIFADVDSKDRDNAKQYFLTLGETVCGWLDRVGYAFCKGEIMAQNPKWCLSVSEWKSNFFSWIRKSTKEDLLNATIFFDFRGAYGNLELIDELRLFLFQTLVGWTRFFRDLAETALEFKPPIGFLKKIVVETKGKHRNKFSIKSAMTPIVDFARIHALVNNIADTNTQDRLYRLHLDKVITKELYKELNQAYDYLMQQRLICQIESIEAGEAPDNYIDPRNLSKMEQTLFRTIFKRIDGLQTKLRMNFIGGI